MVNGKRIRALRILCGWTQQELAQRLSVTWVTVSNWERGRTIPQHVHRKALGRLINDTITAPEGS